MCIAVLYFSINQSTRFAFVLCAFVSHCAVSLRWLRTITSNTTACQRYLCRNIKSRTTVTLDCYPKTNAVRHAVPHAVPGVQGVAIGRAGARCVPLPTTNIQLDVGPPRPLGRENLGIHESLLLKEPNESSTCPAKRLPAGAAHRLLRGHTTRPWRTSTRSTLGFASSAVRTSARSAWRLAQPGLCALRDRRTDSYVSRLRS